MKFRQIFVAALAVCVGLMYGASAQAESSFSGSVKLTTNYAFQGASDSDGIGASRQFRLVPRRRSVYWSLGVQRRKLGRRRHE